MAGDRHQAGQRDSHNDIEARSGRKERTPTKQTHVGSRVEPSHAKDAAKKHDANQNAGSKRDPST